MDDLERREAEELVTAVGVGDVSVAFVVGDLAGQWVSGKRERKTEVSELVKRVREQWPEFGVMFDREVRRRSGSDQSHVSRCALI